MTAIEIIREAGQVTTETSMLKLSSLERNMRAMEDIISTPEVIEAWRISTKHLQDTIDSQMELAAAGTVIRIM